MTGAALTEAQDPGRVMLGTKRTEKSICVLTTANVQKQQKLNNVGYVYVYKEIINAKFREQKGNKSTGGVSVMLVIEESSL